MAGGDTTYRTEQTLLLVVAFLHTLGCGGSNATLVYAWVTSPLCTIRKSPVVFLCKQMTRLSHLDEGVGRAAHQPAHTHTQNKGATGNNITKDNSVLVHAKAARSPRTAHQ